jgi:hypothetical protein
MEYTKPLPVASAESQPFWEGCRQHKLLVQRCEQCHGYWFPPATLCPHCLSPKWAWTEASGGGKVYTFVVFQRAYHPGFKGEIPYCVALIQLDEGPRMLSNVVGDPKDVQCDARVQVLFDDVTEQVSLPKFQLSHAKPNVGDE